MTLFLQLQHEGGSAWNHHELYQLFDQSGGTSQRKAQKAQKIQQAHFSNLLLCMHQRDKGISATIPLST
jgi:hypothetical protein